MYAGLTNRTVISDDEGSSSHNNNGDSSRKRKMKPSIPKLGDHASATFGMHAATSGVGDKAKKNFTASTIMSNSNIHVFNSNRNLNSSGIDFPLTGNTASCPTTRDDDSFQTEGSAHVDHRENKKKQSADRYNLPSATTNDSSSKWSSKRFELSSMIDSSSLPMSSVQNHQSTSNGSQQQQQQASWELFQNRATASASRGALNSLSDNSQQQQQQQQNVFKLNSLLPQQSVQQQRATSQLLAYNQNQYHEGFLLALQQQHHHQMQLAAAATRTNQMLPLGALVQNSDNASAGSRGSFGNSVSFGGGASAGGRSNNRYSSFPESLSTDLSSDVSSFLDACKNISFGLNTQGKERDLSTCSDFGGGAGNNNKQFNNFLSMDHRSSNPVPQFRDLIRDGLKRNEKLKTPQTNDKKTTIGTGSDKPVENVNVDKFCSEVRREMIKFNSFNDFLDSQKAFAKELYEIAGKVQNEEKLEAALDFYRVESASLVKSCMIKSGFGPEQTEECDKNYVGFLARKLDSEIRRVKRLVDIPLRMKRKAAVEAAASQANAKRIKVNSTAAEEPIPVANVYNAENINETCHDDVSSLGLTY